MNKIKLIKDTDGIEFAKLLLKTIKTFNFKEVQKKVTTYYSLYLNVFDYFAQKLWYLSFSRWIHPVKNNFLFWKFFVFNRNDSKYFRDYFWSLLNYSQGGLL